MSTEPVICVDCSVALVNPARPEYVVKGVRRVIRPKPRCASCRAEYERTHIGPGKGLEVRG